MKACLPLLVLVGCTPEPSSLHAEQVHAQNEQSVAAPSTGAPVLVELYTSEGCSSCPSADAVLRGLAAEPPDGTTVVAVELHVDYWNQLGHVDRFSRPEFSARQWAYQSQFGDRGAYTPEAIVDGQSGLVGSRESALRDAVVAASHRPHAEVTFEGHTVRVGVLPEPVHDARLFAAEIDESPSTRVTKGENAGLTLQHHWVVTRLTDVGAVPRMGGTFPLPGAARVAFVASRAGVLGSAAAP